MKINEQVKLTVQRDGERVVTILPLTRHYDWFFLVINFLAGLFAWIMGVSVFVKKPQGQVIKLYLFSSLSLSLAMFVPRAGYPFGPQEINFILPSFQIFAYTLLPALFFHFSVIFPREEVSRQRKSLIYSGYLPSLALIVLMEIFYWKSISGDSLSLFHTYAALFLVFRIFISAYVLLGLVFLYQTYKRSEFLEEKKKIRWIFWGIAVGSFPFLFLHTLPDVFLGRALIPEVIKSLFVLLIPISFAFSILKYQAMNIDVVINRSLVYTLLTGFILGIYLFVVGLLGSLLHGLTGYRGSLFPILATLAAAILFTPARSRIRILVDRTFYRVRYDYRKAVREFTHEVDSAFNQDQLLNLLAKRIDFLLAAKRLLILVKSEFSDELEIAGSVGFLPEDLKEFEEGIKDLPRDLLDAEDAQGATGATAYEDFPGLPQSRILAKFEIRLSFPMTEKGEFIGLLLLGEKKSEVRYSAEDVELVSLMVQVVTRTVQNIRIKRRVLAEQLEKEKQQELNKLKTKFISNVSHDLKTPLTAIRFSADNMLKGVYGDISEDCRKSLQMIQGSALHVSRTIDNLLTLCLSESGKLILNKEKISLNKTVDEACGMMKSLAGEKGLDLVKEEMPDVFIHADKHSLLEILLNLLDNAMKFTDQGGRISISAKLKKEDELVEVSVADNGVGIAPENLEKIFERFQTAEPAGIRAEKGTGMGLDIVRNLVHLHGGEVKVESPIPGTDKGTRFSFILLQA
jgi:signal transduction histidine kinase